MDVHPRLSVNSICSMRQSFADDLALWADLGVDHVGLITPKFDAFGWDEGVQAVREAKLRVSSMSTYLEQTEQSLQLTADVGTHVLYIPPGPATPAPWEETAAAFTAHIAPLVDKAAALGVTIAIEPTNPLRTDVSFLHTVRDAVDLARASGTTVVVDTFSSWYERGLEKTVRDNLDLIALVQVSDYKLGTFTMPNRCAVGDGDVPVERLLRMLVDAGYTGAFDLEILGPQVEEEGYRAPIARSIERLNEILERAGA